MVNSDKVQKIMLIGSGSVQYLEPVISDLKAKYKKAEIMVYPHSSYITDLPALPGCEIIEYRGMGGLVNKLKFFLSLRTRKKDMLVSLWTGEPQFNRFKVMVFLLKGEKYVIYDEQAKSFQVSLGNYEIIREHYKTHKNLYEGSGADSSEALAGVIRFFHKILKYVLFPFGIIILFLRVAWRLTTFSGKRA